MPDTARANAPSHAHARSHGDAGAGRVVSDGNRRQNDGVHVQLGLQGFPSLYPLLHPSGIRFVAERNEKTLLVVLQNSCPRLC